MSATRENDYARRWHTTCSKDRHAVPRSLVFAEQPLMNVAIKSGDTLSALAQQHGTTVDAIVKANGGKIKDPNLIYAGDTLNIPGKSDSFSPGAGSPRGMSGP